MVYTLMVVVMVGTEVDTNQTSMKTDSLDYKEKDMQDSVVGVT